MTFLGDKDFLIEVRKGNVPGHSMIHKFGHNPAVPNGSFAHLSEMPFAIASFRQSAVAMRVKAGGNGADTAAGAGAQEITIQGIDDITFAEVTDVVATAGAGASAATSTKFWRVHRAWVSAVGTYTVANTAAVIIEDSGGGADFLTIATGEGQTQYAGYTIPGGKTGYLLSVHVTIDSTRPCNVRCFVRENIDDVSAPMGANRIKLDWNGVESPGFMYSPKGPELVINEKSDVWFEGATSGGTAHVSCNFELLLVDN